jgi:hypothetical protein
MDAQKAILLARIEILGKQIEELKSALMAETAAPPVKLEGLWQDIVVTEEDFEDAKRSLFPDIDDI